VLIPKQVLSDSDSIPGRHPGPRATSERLEIRIGTRFHFGMLPGIILESRLLSPAIRTFRLDFLKLGNNALER